jgi:hypothetical protein
MDCIAVQLIVQFLLMSLVLYPLQAAKRFSRSSSSYVRGSVLRKQPVGVTRVNLMAVAMKDDVT